ncbi:MAG: ATP-binding cassette domain-containing protein [Bacteroidaceae bacterium]|nr:ATP-binding cassette domain-containing protein [Bacteroidaceae bacterium]
MKGEHLIDYRHVSVYQQELCILDEIDFHLDAGEFVYLIGKVGSGKTSLLKTFYGELNIQDGDAEVLGYNMRTIKRKHIPTLRRKLGIVFQDFQLLIDRTVTENLDFVLRATGWKNKQARINRIHEVLELVGMSTKGYKLPHQLSGGEQQRIVIARAILNNPQIILADEPTGNLDAETGKHIVELLRDISSRGTAVVMTTHNKQLLYDYPGIVYQCEKHKIEDITREYNLIAHDVEEHTPQEEEEEEVLTPQGEEITPQETDGSPMKDHSATEAQ